MIKPSAAERGHSGVMEMKRLYLIGLWHIDHYI